MFWRKKQALCPGTRGLRLQITLAILDKIRYNKFVRHRSKRQDAGSTTSPRPYAGEHTSHTAEYLRPKAIITVPTDFIKGNVLARVQLLPAV